MPNRLRFISADWTMARTILCSCHAGRKSNKDLHSPCQSGRLFDIISMVTTCQETQAQGFHGQETRQGAGCQSKGCIEDGVNSIGTALLWACLCHPWRDHMPMMSVLVRQHVPPHVVPDMPRMLVHTAPQARVHPGPLLKPAEGSSLKPAAACAQQAVLQSWIRWKRMQPIAGHPPLPAPLQVSTIQATTAGQL